LNALPNAITALRLLLTPLLVYAILRGQWWPAFCIGVTAGVTDVLDGVAARLLQVSSRVGAYLDPIADKLLLSACYLALGLAQALPWWMVALVFGRDIFILAMAAYGYLFTTVREFPPSAWGKLSTFVQIVAAMMVVAEKAGSGVPSAPALWAMVVTTVWSGIHYGWKGFKVLGSRF
jgi:cardiolipin synthase (CMP-forming)